ncbi:MAG: hypothetical protein K0S20_789 [Patescibacteria group bacterium]|jgi:ferredoxin|nr:hypothetical protein [Patescibacteria group bacterium]
MEPELVPATVSVDREMCLTAATCLAYSIYELDDEEKAVLLTKNGLNSDDLSNPLTTPEGTVKIEDLVNTDSVEIEQMRDLVLESAKACPFNAIIVKDKDGNQIWPPL